LLRSRENGHFSDGELGQLSEAAPLLIAACAKHAATQLEPSGTALNFASVEQIENKLRRSDWKLTERELQVSARILYGISALGIALDLGLGEETIATYRKRLYQRLCIGSRHELFQKYLELL
jgi:DNA-binding NarL/FixJ family response regulator